MSGAVTRDWRQDVARLASAAVLAQALPLLVLPWITRHYLAEDLGRWALFASVAASLATVACGRYEYAIVLPRRESQARSLLALCGALALGWAVLLALLSPLAMGLGAGVPRLAGLGPLVLMLAPAVALAGVQQALTLWHNRGGDYSRIGQSRLVAPGLTALLQAAGGLLGAGAVWLVAAQVAGQAAAVGRLAWRVRWPRAAERRWRRLRVLARRHRAFPLVNAPHAFVNALQDSLSLALVLALAGPAAAGLFGLMVRVVMAPTSLIGGALSEVLLGRAATLAREGGALAPMVARAQRVLALFALPIAAALMLLGPGLFELAFGADWRVAGEWARWLAPCMAGRMIVGPLTVLPMVLERQHTALLFSVCGNAAYVLALGGVLLAGGSLAQACAAVSVAMVTYFGIYLGWLRRLVAEGQA